MGRSPTGVRAPRGGIHESVGTFVSGAGTGAVVERRGKVFFLDRVVLGSRGRGRGRRSSSSSSSGGDGGLVDGLIAFSPGLTGFVSGSHGCVQRGEFSHHAFVLVLLICMDGLSVLA